jgi:hypothetical protein
MSNVKRAGKIEVATYERLRQYAACTLQDKYIEHRARHRGGKKIRSKNAG